MSCVDACPVADTLDLKSIYTKKKINKKLVAIGVVSIFLAVTGFAMFSGHWQNDITKHEYLIHYKLMDSYGHPTGTAAIKEFKKEESADVHNNSKAKEKLKNHNKF
jgi:hypothetical protein